MTKIWRFVGINFDHMHMGWLLDMVNEHPQAEIVGICDDNVQRMEEAITKFSLSNDKVFTEVEKCLDESKPDVVILCPANREHANLTEQIAKHKEGYHILIDKPFAENLYDADRMITATDASGKILAINWPLAWYPPHRTTKRLIDEGIIGEPIEVHYYDGNRADMIEEGSWFLRKDQGGGSLLDYLGYGSTLGTWFMNNRTPIEVMTMTNIPPGWEVDNHSITILRYEMGLSKLETRWGTFTSPWIHQPQPKCGFVIVGTKGTISSYDYENSVKVQTEASLEGYDVSVDELKPPYQNCVQYLVHCLETDTPLQGPTSITTSRIGQIIVDAAIRSIESKSSVFLND